MTTSFRPNVNLVNQYTQKQPANKRVSAQPSLGMENIGFNKANSGEGIKFGCTFKNLAKVKGGNSLLSISKRAYEKDPIKTLEIINKRISQDDNNLSLLKNIKERIEKGTILNVGIPSSKA